MMVGSLMRRMVVPCRKKAPLRHRISFTTTTHDSHASQILMSPSLVSLDLPDVWAPNSSHFQVPSPGGNFSNEQTAAVINGLMIADEIRPRIASEVRRMQDSIGEVPGLAVILVGERRDSQTYVRNKIIACEEVGIVSTVTELPDDCTEDELLNAVASFNVDPSVHGILVQLPLPQHLDVGKISDVLSLEKDVDGFHPVNIGNLAMRGREPLFISCTPKGCIELLIRSGIEIMGKKAVVIGRSNIVGLPASLLLQRHHATVSVVHAFTKNPAQITREADILITAVGMPNLVRGNWLKPGVVVVDVGTNPIEDASCECGYRLMGDVCFEEAVKVASAITPVPGGVGPMTIAMLLSNTLDAAKRAHSFT
ncbi:Tetrahydrofolate dehydrogenase/cyclohydrolase [Parasponia andersonii]|uniref:Tetrahydrofolate dehydrogenase/cyclohydrolase n=1 Tax=Parasponia andersonii TaxID=3476 RepID=A0A2P5A9U5_PARAD|nr:Tetrahydrofolate dehydrogenase/cyclohydrolase [Parasponia andersonii]